MRKGRQVFFCLFLLNCFQLKIILVPKWHIWADIICYPSKLSYQSRDKLRAESEEGKQMLYCYLYTGNKCIKIVVFKYKEQLLQKCEGISNSETRIALNCDDMTDEVFQIASSSIFFTKKCILNESNYWLRVFSWNDNRYLGFWVFLNKGLISNCLHTVNILLQRIGEFSNVVLFAYNCYFPSK